MRAETETEAGVAAVAGAVEIEILEGCVAGIVEVVAVAVVTVEIGKAEYCVAAGTGVSGVEVGAAVVVIAAVAAAVAAVVLSLDLVPVCLAAPSGCVAGGGLNDRLWKYLAWSYRLRELAADQFQAASDYCHQFGEELMQEEWLLVHGAAGKVVNAVAVALVAVAPVVVAAVALEEVQAPVAVGKD